MSVHPGKHKTGKLLPRIEALIEFDKVPELLDTSDNPYETYDRIKEYEFYFEGEYVST